MSSRLPANWFDPEGSGRQSGGDGSLLRRLREEGIIRDTSGGKDLQVLRADVERIASDMDDPARPPPMFWSGIPLPPVGPEPSCDYQLVISVGGTKTDFALLRLERGRPICLDPLSGRETDDPEEIDRIKRATQMATPRHGPEVPTGAAMISLIVRHLARHLARHPEARERCEAILLSWGFAHRIIRTGERLAGGLSARVTIMTKDQAGFTADLGGKDVGLLFDQELRAQLSWSRPIAVANDTVMALHYFLSPSRRSGHARVGLFINGTGSNFSAAEAFGVRREGFISSGGEDYAPERITRKRPLAPGEVERLFLVNYEAGSTELAGTRTRFDTETEYPIERNALGAGNAFGQGLRDLVREFIGEEVYAGIEEVHRRTAGGKAGLPGGPVVSALAGGTREVEALLGSELAERHGSSLRIVARAIIARSALHAALILAAVTLRTGFGLGEGGQPDLLGLEGSVWKIPGYQELVRAYWQDLLPPRADGAGGEQLRVDFAAEPSFNASLPGPLYLAALHR